MDDVPVRIRMNETADGLEEGTEWFGYRDSSGWFAVDKAQGEGPQRNWRCVMPQEAVVVEYTDGTGTSHDADYAADGYPYPRPARWIRTSPLNPDMADMADPPDKEDR
jgi:hypothetical protein